ncbi:MAG: 6-phosphofructokinase [Amphiamblys sp. WSBS2006]|nr:MAG: 6-phosphofructokinase [Amphiamblys sp. WSBS2006]
MENNPARPVFSTPDKEDKNTSRSEGKRTTCAQTTESEQESCSVAQFGNENSVGGKNKDQTPHGSEIDGRAEAIGFLTSGGDSPGMNPAIRAIVRTAINKGLRPYAIYDGYAGLIEGGDKIKELGWYDVGNLLSEGGTAIRSSRSEEFRTEAGRLGAVKNMVERNIKHLVIIGGDGSMTGASIFKNEWKGLVTKLHTKGEISAAQKEAAKKITVAGLCGSIDNDMYGTDVTIGSFSSLQRVVEAIDTISCTAASHKRAFIIEVMGRHCGWLAMMAYISLSADWVFLPEDPPEPEKWKKDICATLRLNREKGKSFSIVIVAEGAIDRELSPIKTEDVKTVISTCLGYDTRATILGHLQRGGMPSPYDRYLATLQGVEAVNFIAEQIEDARDDEPVLICIEENKILRKPLMECVRKTHMIQKALSEKRFDEVVSMRGKLFRTFHRRLKEFDLSLESQRAQKKVSIAVVNIGPPAAGMNAAAKTVVQYAHIKGYSVLGARNGLVGFADGAFQKLGFMEVESWMVHAGAKLASSRKVLGGDNIGRIAAQIEKNNIAALVVIGGLDAFNSVRSFVAERKSFPEFCIPITLLPATDANEIPGTNVSLGVDTALNVVTVACEALKISAASSHRRVFVVQVHGKTCGYLAVMAGLTTGATNTYIPEHKIKLRDLAHCASILKKEFAANEEQGKILIMTETGDKTEVYTPETFAKIIQRESDGVFDARTCNLGHAEQGLSTSPLDRIYAYYLGHRCASFICDELDRIDAENAILSDYFVHREQESAIMVRIKKSLFEAVSVEEIFSRAEAGKKYKKQKWWYFLKSLSRSLEIPEEFQESEDETLTECVE